MPCDTIQTTSVNLEMKTDNITLLIPALKSLGYNVQDLGETVRFTTREGVTGTFAADGNLTVTSRDSHTGSRRRRSSTPTRLSGPTASRS